MKSEPTQSAQDPEVIDWHNEYFDELGPLPSLERMIEIAADIDVRN